MESPDVLEPKLRTALKGRVEFSTPLDRIIAGEKGVFRGFLVHAAGLVHFVKDRFGTLEFDSTLEPGTLEAVEVRPGFMGWELRAREKGRDLRISRLAESDARELARLLGAGAVPAPPPPPRSEGARAPAPAEPSATRVPEEVAHAALHAPVVPEPSLSGAVGTDSPESYASDARAGVEPPGEPPAPSEAVLDLGPEEPAPPPGSAPPSREPGPAWVRVGRDAVLAAMRADRDPSPAAGATIRQIESLPESAPSDLDVAGVLARWSEALERGEEAGDPPGAPFGLKALIPLIGIVDDPRAPAPVRRVAAKWVSRTRSKRLLSFLGARAHRERDPAVARLLFEGLAGIGGEAASRSVLKVVEEGAEPFRSEALEVLAGSSWAPTVRSLAALTGSPDAAFSARVGSACARILRLPPGEADPAGGEGARAGIFLRFWRSHGAKDPVELLKASIEENIDALRSADRARAAEAARNLDALTQGYEAEAAKAPGTRGDEALARSVWWARTRGRPPKEWLHPAYLDGLSVPAPKFKAPEPEPEKKPEKAKKAAESVPALGYSLNSVGLRALAAGLLAGGFLFVMEGELKEIVDVHVRNWLDMPVWLRGPVLWTVIAAAGPLALFQPARLLRLLPWAVAASLVLSAGGHKPHDLEFRGIEFLPWAILAAGYLRIRRVEVWYVLGPIAAAMIFFGATYVPKAAFGGMNDVEASITLGIVSLLFWFVLFLAEIPAKEAGKGKGK